MADWSATRSVGNLTSIPTTFMQTPKLDSEQKVVKKVVFLSLHRVHDRASWGHDCAPLTQPKTLNG